MVMRRFSPSEERRVVKLYKQGYSTTEIAEAAGCAINTVRRVLIYNDVELRDKCPTLIWTKGQLRQIYAMYRKGATLNEVGEAFGCSGPTIHGLLKKAGLKARSRGRRAETKRRTRT